MKVRQAIEIMRLEHFQELSRFQEHYERGILLTDYYPESNTLSEWYEQFEAFLSLEEEGIDVFPTQVGENNEA